MSRLKAHDTAVSARTAGGRALARLTGERVLLVDIGNTRIKWAMWRGGRLGRMQADEHDGWSEAEFGRRLFRGRAVPPTRVIAASVASTRVVRRLSAAARRETGTAPDLVATSRRAAGVVTRYTEPWRLGVDRFMGVIGAHHLSGGRGACVVNVGTAVTIDFVDGRGVHHGGAILPGPRLMIDSLLQRTAGIARRAEGPSSRGRGRSGGVGAGASLFAQDTAGAIERGAWQAVAGAVEHGFGECLARTGAEPLLMLTGGGAAGLRRLLRVPHVEVQNLVLAGIAVHAGLELR